VCLCVCGGEGEGGGRAVREATFIKEKLMEN
jgi:hypothetical protein